MAQETIHAFDLALEGIDLLDKYARRTLDLAKPKAIVSERVLAPGVN
jgi:hypothetical protein